MTVLLLFAAPVSAQTFPKLTGRVVDDAHILTPAVVADLTSKSQAIETKTGRQLVVATVPSLQGYPIEDYGYRLGRAWGIGQKGLDNGVILLVAPNERKVRIEVGYGATAYVTDAMSSIIIRNSILPHFKQSPPDYGGGIEAGADQLIGLMSLSPDQAEQAAARAQQQEQAHRTSSGGGLPLIFWGMIFLFIILSKFRRVGGRRYYRRGGISPWVVLWGLNEAARASRGGGWGGGGFGGGGGGGFGGFSGGGGSFGGGGASGSW
ncbi:MAG: TPM domain-containing protein [Sphingomicrobium sp.]